MTYEEMKKVHRSFAVNCFNTVWDLLDKQNRTPDEDMKMIHAAHCSRFHWGELGTDLEFQRGEWQISRVYAVLGMGESALYHAECCHRTCVEKGMGDFDMAFSLEGLARAHKVLGNIEESENFKNLATKAAADIEDSENRDYFFSELASIS